MFSLLCASIQASPYVNVKVGGSYNRSTIKNKRSFEHRPDLNYTDNKKFSKNGFFGGADLGYGVKIAPTVTLNGEIGLTIASATKLDLDERKILDDTTLENTVNYKRSYSLQTQFGGHIRTTLALNLGKIEPFFGLGFKWSKFKVGYKFDTDKNQETTFNALGIAPIGGFKFKITEQVGVFVFAEYDFYGSQKAKLEQDEEFVKITDSIDVKPSQFNYGAGLQVKFW